MQAAERDIYADQGVEGAAPVGWSLAMALCNALIAASILAFLGFVAYDTSGFGLLR